MSDGGLRRNPSGAGQLSMTEPRGLAPASNDQASEGFAEDLDLLVRGECRFEIYRKNEQRVSSTRFCGGDWSWRLVTTEGHVLAEAAGYPSQGICEVALSALRERAASALVQILADQDPR